MKELKTITLRVSNEHAEMFATLGEGSVNRGVVAMAAKLRTLNTLADREIKGIFTPAEWSFLADTLNGIIIDDATRYNAQLLAIHNEDAQHYDGAGTKWGVDVATLNDKVMRLSSAQVDAIYRRIERYWSSEPAPSLEEWAKF